MGATMRIFKQQPQRAVLNFLYFSARNMIAIFSSIVNTQLKLTSAILRRYCCIFALQSAEPNLRLHRTTDFIGPSVTLSACSLAN